jgi:hypothetical protein
MSNSIHVTFTQWMHLRPQIRRTFLDSIESGDEDADFLKLIAPELRVPRPEYVDNYENIQRDYEATIRGESIPDSNHLLAQIRQMLERQEIRISAIQKEIIEKQETQTEIMERQMLAIQKLSRENESIKLQLDNVLNINRDLFRLPDERPNFDIMRASGQDRTLNQVLHSYASISDPPYQVFQTFQGLENTIHQYFIQPYGTTSYEDAIRHALFNPASPILDVLQGASISLVFECFVNGKFISLYFKDIPNKYTIEQYVDEIFGETGSGRLRDIRYNISSVRINVDLPYTGGAKYHSPPSHLRIKKLKNEYPNSCFYECIRQIWKAMNTEKSRRNIKHITYNQMRTMLMNNEADIPVPLDKMQKAEEVFDVKLIVLGSRSCSVHRISSPYNASSYEEAVTEYEIRYNILVGPIFKDKRNYKVPFNKANGIAFITIDRTDYFIICMYNNHYALVNTIIRPSVCEKCGSSSHTYQDVIRSARTKKDCLKELEGILMEDILNKAMPPRTLVFFDFETITIDNSLRVISGSWKYRINGQPIIKHKIGFDTVYSFLEDIRNIYGIKILIGYNSSGFDNYFIMMPLLQAGMKFDSNNCIVHRGYILRIDLCDIITWDMYQFTRPLSLNQACEAWDINDRKANYNYKELQTAYNKYGKNLLLHIDLNQLRNYNNQDVELLEKLVMTATAQYTKLFNMDPFSYMTISQMAFRKLREDLKNRGINMNKIPIEYNEIFSSIPAGRVQAIEHGIYDGNWIQLDKNGLYMWVCLNFLMPNGIITYSESFEPDKAKNKLYLSNCSVDQTHLSFKLIPKRTDNIVDWTSDIVKDVWLWTEEIEMAEQLGCKVTKTKTLIWSDKVDGFKVMEEYRNNREKTDKTKAWDTANKSAANNTTGKCIQNNKNEIWMIVRNAQQKEQFKTEYKNVRIGNILGTDKILMVGEKEDSEYINKPRHWGCRIYAMARLTMYKDLYKAEVIPKYIDTDGIIIKKEEMDRFNIGNKNGQYKIEAEASRLYIVSRKTYCLENGFNNKYRMKGYHNGDIWKSYDTNNNIVKEGNELCIQLYEELLNKNRKVISEYERLIKSFKQHQTDKDKWEIATIKSIQQEKILS